MSRARNDAVLRQIRTLFDAGSFAGLSDGQLLDRFGTGRGESAEAAFAALIDRHGPRVLRTCKSALGDPNDAMDAFQATFLVLARRAGAIRDREAIGGWLVGVAARVSANARREAARRREMERRSAETKGDPAPDGHPDQDEIGVLVREEVGRLPDRFREVVVLCDFEGHSCEEAATRLRCPVGTVKSRRSAARDRLRESLTRRGLAPSAVAISAALAAEAIAAPSVPAILSKSTIEAAISFASRHATTAGGEVPAAVAALAEGVIRTMIWTKAKYAVVAAGMLAVSGVAAVGQQPASSKPASEPNAEARLQEVEKKLDRVIRALEGPRTAPVVMSGQRFNYIPFEPPPSATVAKYAQTPYAEPSNVKTIEHRGGDASAPPRVASVDENGWTEVVTVYHPGKPPQGPGASKPEASPDQGHAATQPARSGPAAEVGTGFVTVMIPRSVTDSEGKTYTVSDLYRQAAGQSDAPLALVRYADPAPTTPPTPPQPPFTTTYMRAGGAYSTPQPATAAPTRTAPEDINRTNVALAETTRFARTQLDPIAALDRRVAELEKRLDRLEKRLDGDGRPSRNVAEPTAPASAPQPPPLPPAPAVSGPPAPALFAPAAPAAPAAPLPPAAPAPESSAEPTSPAERSVDEARRARI